MAKRKFLTKLAALLLAGTMCLGFGCGGNGEQKDPDNGGDTPIVNPDIPDNPVGGDEGKVTVAESGLNIKTISIKAGKTVSLSDYHVALPETDCNYFLFELLAQAYPSNLTIRLTDTADENNYLDIKAKITKKAPMFEGETVEEPSGIIEYTAQPNGGEESETMATPLAWWDTYGSGGALQDTFKGYIWQFVYDGGSGRVGCFNVGSSFTSIGDFSAEKVIVSFTSDVDQIIGLRYFGDTLDWDTKWLVDGEGGGGTLDPTETTLVKKTLWLMSGDTYELTDYPLTLPTTEQLNWFLAELLVQGSGNLKVRLTDTEDAENYVDICMNITGSTITFYLQEADNLPTMSYNGALALQQNYSSDCELQDVFNGYCIQLQYEADGSIGLFNIPESFKILEYFTADTVTVSFTSDADMIIGIRYFGDTKDWMKVVEPDEPAAGSTLVAKTVNLKANETYALTDYPVTLPTTDCNFFLTEMYVGKNCTFTMKVADAANADNWFELKFVLEGQTLTMTYKKAGGEEGTAYTGVVAIGSGVGSGGTLTDTFNGGTIQLVYNGASGTIGWFNVPASFVSLDGFTATSVIVSFTSNVDNTIGLRYFGDTLDWKTE